MQIITTIAAIVTCIIIYVNSWETVNLAALVLAIFMAPAVATGGFALRRMFPRVPKHLQRKVPPLWVLILAQTFVIGCGAACTAVSLMNPLADVHLLACQAPQLTRGAPAQRLKPSYRQQPECLSTRELHF